MEKTKHPLEKATFAGGCFWCMEPPFNELSGVISVTSGYTGGHKAHPTYQEVCSGLTGHAEAVQIVYNPGQVTYAELLDIFWHNINPTQTNGQFADTGSQYRTAIFYHNETQKQLAEASKERLQQSNRFDGKIVTEIVPAATFYEAEAYHQGYCRKNPDPYKRYRYGSGRDHYLHQIWKARPNGK